MPIKILQSGATVTVDAEDWELVADRDWYVWQLCPSKKEVASAKQRRFGREFRLLLHREVVLRMRPELVKSKFRVIPANGDYLDCRRENLNVVMAKRKVGRPKIEPRPTGYVYQPKYRGKSSSTTKHEISDAWAGGYEYLDINREYKGQGRRVRKCIAGKPID